MTMLPLPPIRLRAKRPERKRSRTLAVVAILIAFLVDRL